MSFLRCLCADFREGFFEARSRHLLVFVVALIVILFSWLVAAARGYGSMAFSLADSIASCLGGIGVFDPQRDRFFSFPAAWMLMLLMIANVTLVYPYRDFMGFGKSLLVASGSRWSWWLSKCLWVVTASTVSCLLVCVAALLASAVCGGGVRLVLGSDVPWALGFEFSAGASLEMGGYLASVPVMMAALSLVQLALSLALRPVLAYGATATILLVSAYVFSPLLPGNYLMAARTREVIDTGTSPAVGCALALAISLVAVVLGGIRFSRMDCMDKEYSS